MYSIGFRAIGAGRIKHNNLVQHTSSRFSSRTDFNGHDLRMHSTQAD